jgi:hypothetical protein
MEMFKEEGILGRKQEVIKSSFPELRTFLS